eukprot:COSAG05_NODE_1577_length_4502_cov_3.764706_3_plen_127_part_00
MGLKWGDFSAFQFVCNSTESVKNQLQSGVVKIYHNSFAFAALTTSGAVITWGRAPYGGDSSATNGELLSDVVEVYTNGGWSWSALKKNGRVVRWGTGSGLNSLLQLAWNYTYFVSQSSSTTGQGVL